MSGRWAFDYDGLIGEGWSGVDPDGAHVNVVPAQRGTATAAALLPTFTGTRACADPDRRGRGHGPYRAGLAADDQ